VRARHTMSAYALMLVMICSIAGCDRSERSLLWVNYECEFTVVDGDRSTSDVIPLQVGIDLGSGQSSVGNDDVWVQVDAVPDAGRLVLHYPSRPGRQLAIGRDGKAILIQPETSRASKLVNYDGNCKRL
jgi:hypothetical protein